MFLIAFDKNGVVPFEKVLVILITITKGSPGKKLSLLLNLPNDIVQHMSWVLLGISNGMEDN